jgi:hypothetical protein
MNSQEKMVEELRKLAKAENNRRPKEMLEKM